MLLVRTYTNKSRIHGIGLFAAEPIPAGTPAWQFDPEVDKTSALPYAEPLDKYSWRAEGSLWVLCGDNARFMNHSKHPNIKSNFDLAKPDTAIRDIAAGEELTVDYSTFDLDAPLYIGTLE